ncbi:MAG: WbqC family protein [Bacteroidales bacterium]|nr:WbqC family protein [Bacteroidales bacterium]
MQPYFFPYTGYFQLINAADIFVFYDDVHYINRGWINRNKILINDQARYITVQLKSASQNKRINQIEILDNRDKLLKSIALAYKQAPYYQEVMPLLEACLGADVKHIAGLAALSVRAVCDYLGIKREFLFSGVQFQNTVEERGADRLISIARQCGAPNYINAIGGKELYSKEYFRNKGISLCFVQPELTGYRQFNDTFVPGLSIIDVLMFNSAEETRSMLNNYTLI